MTEAQTVQQLYEALFGLYNVVVIQRFELDPGQRPVLKDGVFDQHMVRASIALRDAEASGIKALEGE